MPVFPPTDPPPLSPSGDVVCPTQDRPAPSQTLLPARLGRQDTGWSCCGHRPQPGQLGSMFLAPSSVPMRLLASHGHFLRQHAAPSSLLPTHFISHSRGGAGLGLLSEEPPCNPRLRTTAREPRSEAHTLFTLVANTGHPGRLRSSPKYCTRDPTKPNKHSAPGPSGTPIQQLRHRAVPSIPASTPRGSRCWHFTPRPHFSAPLSPQGEEKAGSSRVKQHPDRSSGSKRLRSRSCKETTAEAASLARRGASFTVTPSSAYRLVRACACAKSSSTLAWQTLNSELKRVLRNKAVQNPTYVLEEQLWIQREEVGLSEN